MLSWLTGTDKFVDMLSNPTFWYTIVAIIGVIVVIIACFKFPKMGKYIIFSLLGTVLLIMTAYSLVQLEKYYSAKGGTYGQLKGFFETNKAEELDTNKLSITNIELLQNDTDTNVYSASLQITDVYILENDSEYLILINSVPCTSSENQSDYVKAEYTYTFYNKNKEEILTDTLDITFAFYSKSTRLTLETDGGLEAVGLWNYYFNKNTFVVELVQKSKTSQELNFVTTYVPEVPETPKCEVNISSDIDFVLKIGETETYVLGNSNVQDSIDISKELETTDTISILFVDSSYSLAINTDGTCTETYDNSTMYRIVNFENATYLNVEILSNE